VDAQRATPECERGRGTSGTDDGGIGALEVYVPGWREVPR
jgi:hypothetical protein